MGVMVGSARRMNSRTQVVSTKRRPAQSEEMPAFIGIDYHKTYSVYSVLYVLRIVFDRQELAGQSLWNCEAALAKREK